MPIYERMDKFNPAAFGLTTRYAVRGRGKATNENYIIFGSHGDGNGSLTISIVSAVGERIIETLGETVDFDFDKDGVIYLWPGNSRSVSKNNKFPNARYMISVTVMLDDYIKRVGEFRKLYIRPEFYGNYVKLTPTGKRDLLVGDSDGR